MNSWWKLSIAGLIGMIAPISAFATQYVNGLLDIAQTVNVSKKEMTRISIEDGYISDLQAIVGELDTKKDEVTGQVYIRPLVSKPINLFIKSERGNNYLLKLKPTVMDADSIIIREGSAVRENQARANQSTLSQSRELQRNSEAYTSSIKSFIKAITTRQLDGDVSCGDYSGEEVPLWKEAFFVKIGQCTTPNMQAQLFNLTNISGKQMVLDEQEFFKKGVIAVVILEHQLQPNEKTDVYVVFAN